MRPCPLLLTLLLAVSPSAQAQPHTGDAWLDARLGDISLHAHGDLDGFIDEVALRFGTPRPLLRDWVVDRGYPPADIYLVAGYADVLGRPPGDVFDVYRQHRGQGWGAIARRLGVKPGSDAFHALKGKVKAGRDWSGHGPPGYDRGPPGKDRGNRGHGKHGKEGRHD